MTFGTTIVVLGEAGEHKISCNILLLSLSVGKL
jgi:hypothetical protein